MLKYDHIMLLSTQNNTFLVTLTNKINPINAEYILVLSFFSFFLFSFETNGNPLQNTKYKAAKQYCPFHPSKHTLPPPKCFI